MGACKCSLYLHLKILWQKRSSPGVNGGLWLQVPSESEKVVVEQLFQRDAVVRQSQVTNAQTVDKR